MRVVPLGGVCLALLLPNQARAQVAWRSAAEVK